MLRAKGIYSTHDLVLLSPSPFGSNAWQHRARAAEGALLQHGEEQHGVQTPSLALLQSTRCALAASAPCTRRSQCSGSAEPCRARADIFLLRETKTDRYAVQPSPREMRLPCDAARGFGLLTHSAERGDTVCSQEASNERGSPGHRSSTQAVPIARHRAPTESKKYAYLYI